MFPDIIFLFHFQSEGLFSRHRRSLADRAHLSRCFNYMTRRAFRRRTQAAVVAGDLEAFSSALFCIRKARIFPQRLNDSFTRRYGMRTDTCFGISRDKTEFHLGSDDNIQLSGYSRFEFSFSILQF